MESATSCIRSGSLSPSFRISDACDDRQPAKGFADHEIFDKSPDDVLIEVKDSLSHRYRSASTNISAAGRVHD
jgi:hypothetical protein